MRSHRIICRGVFEERVYEDGRLVEVRRYQFPAAKVVTRRVPRHRRAGARVA
jgi:hypothetical protein